MNDLGPIRFRDLTPKDFYFIQVLKNAETPDGRMAVQILGRLLLHPEDLEVLSIGQTRKTFDWALENLLTQKIMSVESWLQTAFHLCKQRWDASVDWLESQPVPKILLMIEIVNQHVKAQEAEMKKSARKK